MVLVDDGEMAEPYLKRIVKEKRMTENSVGRFLYGFFELLIAKTCTASRRSKTAQRRWRTACSRASWRNSAPR